MRDVEAHLPTALRSGGLCPNDPICAQRIPGEGIKARWIHGAACHGCALVAETSCEMREPTEKAFDENFEVGLLTRDRTVASALARHFSVLIERDILEPLPG